MGWAGLPLTDYAFSNNLENSNLSPGDTIYITEWDNSISTASGAYKSGDYGEYGFSSLSKVKVDTDQICYDISYDQLDLNNCSTMTSPPHDPKNSMLKMQQTSCSGLNIETYEDCS